jgi:uncharacterized protein YbbC (DUF1343 family)
VLNFTVTCSRCVVAAIVCMFVGCCSIRSAERVLTGLDVFEAEGFERLHGRRVAVVTNQTAVNAKGDHLLDLLDACPEIEVAAIFGPEHGVLGNVEAGGAVGDSTEGRVPVYSLYGKIRRPDRDLHGEFDVMLYDIQDVGARFYTYIWTLFNVMQFCAEEEIPLIVLDRPNPLGGEIIEGPVLEEEFASSVGMRPIPIRYGLTVGELARMFNEERWLGDGVKADLNVVRMQGWRRDMLFPETGLTWIPPSPNMPTYETAAVYPGTCMFEGVSWSEGRGLDTPFEIVGGPNVDGEKLADELNGLDLPGCSFKPVSFTPKSIPGVVSQPKHEGKKCEGVFIQVEDPGKFRPVETGLTILTVLKKTYPHLHQWREKHFDRLLGTDTVRKQIEAGTDPKSISDACKTGVNEFSKARTKILLY